jgi:hypothetical protein
LIFAIVHALNGFAYGAVTTLYMAFYVDSLAPDENRNHVGSILVEERAQVARRVNARRQARRVKTHERGKHVR